MLGPIAIGLIIRYLHWRYIFFVNLAICIAGLILVYMHLPDGDNAAGGIVKLG